MREIRAFTVSEAALVLIAGVILGAGLGLLLAEMLIAMLQHAFDPPPDHLAVPWRYLAELVGAAVIGSAVATAITARSQAKMNLGAILREQ
jgi:putative ABC transport system permease protein